MCVCLFGGGAEWDGSGDRSRTSSVGVVHDLPARGTCVLHCMLRAGKEAGRRVCIETAAGLAAAPDRARRDRPYRAERAVDATVTGLPGPAPATSTQDALLHSYFEEYGVDGLAVAAERLNAGFTLNQVGRRMRALGLLPARVPGIQRGRDRGAGGRDGGGDGAHDGSDADGTSDGESDAGGASRDDESDADDDSEASAASEDGEASAASEDGEASAASEDGRGTAPAAATSPPRAAPPATAGSKHPTPASEGSAGESERGPRQAGPSWRGETGADGRAPPGSSAASPAAASSDPPTTAPNPTSKKRGRDAKSPALGLPGPPSALERGGDDEEAEAKRRAAALETLRQRRLRAEPAAASADEPRPTSQSPQPAAPGPAVRRGGAGPAAAPSQPRRRLMKKANKQPVAEAMAFEADMMDDE